MLTHATRRRFIPPTPRRAIESYWRAHPVRADRLARALAAKSGAPQGWTWRLAQKSGPAKPRAARRGSNTGAGEGVAGTFRAPPAPYREGAFRRGPGFCCVCGQAIFRFGWHLDLWCDGEPNRKASWHAACVVAWELWNGPRGYVRTLRKLQGAKCPASGRRLLRNGEVDHVTPLYRVWREHRSSPWPRLLAFWGVPNLQVVNRDAHRDKCQEEVRERKATRASKETAARIAIG